MNASVCCSLLKIVHTAHFFFQTIPDVTFLMTFVPFVITISFVFHCRVVYRPTASSCLLPSASQELPTCFLSCLKQKTRHFMKSARHLPKGIKYLWKCKKWTTTQGRGNRVQSKNQISHLLWTTGKPKKGLCKPRMLFWGAGENMLFSFSMFIAVHNFFYVTARTASPLNMF